MGYGFSLVRVPSGLGPNERRAAARRRLDEEECSVVSDDERAQRRAMPPSAEQSRLAELLRAKFPKLRVTHASANHIELTQRALWVQVSIFEDAAGIGMHPGGFSTTKYIEALRFAWDCLELLEREGGFATYDSQCGRVLDLATDFETVLVTLAGDRAVKKHRDAVARAAESYESLLASANGPAKSYDATATFAVGDLVAHRTFGAGVVRAVAPPRVTILFQAGTKVLVCAPT
jgi:hypothetical protein